MAIKIFDVDPDAAPRPQAPDVVGRFRSGMALNGRPMSLQEWRVTTGDPEVADAIAEILGSEEGPQEWEASGEDTLEVMTDAQSVEVILEDPSAIRSQMVLWGRNGKLIRSCDGITQKDDDGTPCACPSTVAERKEAAKAGHGCEPSVTVDFRLAAAPDLGVFRFRSGSWNLAGDIGKAEAELEKAGGPVYATLTLELVEYTTKKGRDVSFTKPVVKVTGPVKD